MGQDPSGAIAGVFKKVIDCAALIIRLFGSAVIYFKLSVVLGAVLFVILGIQIFLGILCQKEVIKLYSLEAPRREGCLTLGSCCAAGTVSTT